MCRPDGQTISRSAAALGRWRPGSPRTSAGALRAGSPLPFPHESSLAPPRGPPAWPAPARPTPAWPLCMARMRQRRADRDGGVVARSAPGLLFLYPTNPAWPTRLADPLAVADPRGRPPGRRRRGLCARREGGHGGRTSNGGVVARSAPGLLILYPPTSRLADPLAVADPPGRPAWPTRRAGANGTRENTLWFKAAEGVTTNESKAMCVADWTSRPSMRARTPAKLDSFARCRAPHHGPQSRRCSTF